ncbi:MAG: ArsC family reductase [Burkholderiales bacterium]|nr:ArsC family reductase [Burkholderiales bacterium]
MKLYGIPNCDTVKKARVWLDSQGAAYQFHDFKKQGLDTALLNTWVAQVGWQKLVNKQGTTWRKLDPTRQAVVVDAPSAIELMLEYPSLIKRPVLVREGKMAVGFDVDAYTALIS